MIKKKPIEQFEKMGLGLFVHYGLYSIVGKGEWNFKLGTDTKDYCHLINSFDVNKNWAKNIVKLAKKMGAKYINLTTRHHDGFSLYDTKGLNCFDAPHSACKRDLVREFVDECNLANIKPFFYHTLLDWHNDDYQNNFPAYLDYLKKSIKLLCTNYGEIGGFWFDGLWDKPNEDWHLDELFSMIRELQPNSIIINNTGLENLGKVIHKEIDVVTFERGKPFKPYEKDNKYRSGEMCESLTDHWGYAKDDICFKSIPLLIDDLLMCRNNRYNFLINIGPTAKGVIQPLAKETLLAFGMWVKKNKHIIYECEPADIKCDGAMIFKDKKYYYAVTSDVKMAADKNVIKAENIKHITIHTDKVISSPTYLDSGEKIEMVDDKTINIEPFKYGTNFYTRVIRFYLK